MLLETKVIGNLGADCIVKETNGKKAINFSLAYNERFVDSEGTVHESTTWVNCTIWRTKETALIKYLKKGQLVYVSGTPKVTIYRNKQGEPNVDFSLNVQDVKLLGSKPKENDTEPVKESGNGIDFKNAPVDHTEKEGDLPF